MSETKKSTRVVRLAVTGLTVAAVAGITITGAEIAANRKSAANTAAQVPVAGSGAGDAAQGAPPKTSAAPAQTKKPVAKSKYAFQNQPQAIGVVPKNGSVVIAPDTKFQLWGTQWAVQSREADGSVSEPFGRRATIGNDNLGDGTALGIQSFGVGKSALVSSVFNGPKVATVVYTKGKKAWYAKVYRLAGIPGWVESSALVSTAFGPGKKPPADPFADEASIFTYDAAGKLISKFPEDAENPLP